MASAQHAPVKKQYKDKPVPDASQRQLKSQLAPTAVQQNSHQPRTTPLVLQPQILPSNSPAGQPLVSGSYRSPLASVHDISRRQTPNQAGLPLLLPQRTPDGVYYAPHSSPYSTSSNSGNYTTVDTPETMAAAHTITMRQQPMSIYTPQTNSPASIHSPHQDPHARTMYTQAPHPSSLYYSHYPVQQHPSYMQPPSGMPQQQQMPPHSTMAMSFQQQQQPQMPHQQAPHPQRQLKQSPHMDNSPRTKMIPSNAIQRPVSAQMGPPQIPPTTLPTPPLSSQQSPPGTSGQSAAPGPIPATTPLLVKSDQNGVQWIMFEYSRDRIKVQYEIRCDVEHVNTQALSQVFKENNCVYPRACSGKEPYKGNRLQYETDCNEVGWALAELNPALRGKRGLIQRAVDSWRNSNSDSKLRSRRVRRMAKGTKRTQVQSMPSTGSSTGSVPPQASIGMMPLPGIPPTSTPGRANASQLHHHHMQSTTTGIEEQHQQHQQDLYQHQHLQNHPSTMSPRHTQNFYPIWPVHNGKGQSQMPPLHNMDQLGAHTTSHSSNTTMPGIKTEYGIEEAKFFGDIAKTMPRKSITVKDIEKDTNVRVNVKLDGVSLDEIPDSFRQKNSIYPRSYYARHMQSPPRHRGSSVFDDESVEMAGGRFAPSVGRTVVPIKLQDGWETELAIPRTTKSRRAKERALNDLGCRMSWDYVQNFSERPLFIQRSLDTYRKSMQKALSKSGRSVPRRFETRNGRRKWSERSRNSADHNEE